MNALNLSSVVHLSTSVFGGRCEHCRQAFVHEPVVPEFQTQVNHYLEHGYTLLHVGQETSTDDEGNPWHSTVAVLGKPRARKASLR